LGSHPGKQGRLVSNQDTNAARPSISRLPAAAIVELVGAESAAYLLRKNAGGSSGYKGTRYEQIFGAHCIARFAQCLIDRGEDSQIEWQGRGFVDDLFMRLDQTATVHAYQLKNSAQVSWTSGEHPIAEDFRLQHQLSTSEGYREIRIGLVCSDEGVTNALRDDIPLDIAAFTTAEFFPYAEKMLPLIHANGAMAAAYAYLSKHETPTRVELESVATVLMGAWHVEAPAASVGQVLTRARTVQPALIRTLQSDNEAGQQLTKETRSVLGAIPDFQYNITRGFLRWSAISETTWGVLSFDCFTDRFQRWQTKIQQLRPTSFEDIEGELQ
jgi:hypothetical protein